MADRLSSVRARVTLVATGGVLLVLVLMSIAVVRQQRGSLTSNLDEQMEQAAARLVTVIEHGEHVTTLTGFGDDDAAFQVVDAAGEVVMASTNLEGEAPIVADEDGTRTIAGLPYDDADFRVLSTTADGSVLHLAATIDDIDESVHALTRALAISVPIVTFILGVGIWLVVGRALRPVEAIRAEVDAIGGADLHRRVPEPAGDDEIARLARTMNAMIERLETSSEKQRRFVADASHELRSPLTRMRTELEVDEAHPATADREATQRSVLEEVVGMQATVDALLHLARQDAGVRPPFEPVALDEVVRAEAPNAAVVPVVVPGDGAALRLLVRNLVDNAERHAASTVAVELRLDGDTAVLSVTDDGPGIPEADRERVFERFTRLDEARSAAAGGTGLGLAIVRAVAEAHGGRAFVAPGGGPGTRIVVELPGHPRSGGS